MRKIKVPYYVRNGGDGSANLSLMPTLREAEKEDDEQTEGWGESSAGEIELELEDDGRIFFWDWRDVDDDYKRVRIEVKQ